MSMATKNIKEGKVFVTTDRGLVLPFSELTKHEIKKTSKQIKEEKVWLTESGLASQLGQRFDTNSALFFIRSVTAPCQGYSIVGKRIIADERNSLFRQNIRLIGELEPKVFVIENVRGMVEGKMK
ncbi:unnamed protein product, partial [marine sediment metagenome]